MEQMQCEDPCPTTRIRVTLNVQHRRAMPCYKNVVIGLAVTTPDIIHRHRRFGDWIPSPSSG
jgi:hypothetical protein